MAERDDAVGSGIEVSCPNRLEKEILDNEYMEGALDSSDSESSMSPCCTLTRDGDGTGESGGRP